MNPNDFRQSEKLEDYHQENHHKKNTRARVRNCLNHWKRLGLDELTSESLADYRDQRLAEGRASSTVRCEVIRLRSLGKYMGIAVKVKVPKPVARAPVAWSRRQIKQLFHTARKTRRLVYGIPGSIFWPALLGVTYDTAERIGAVMTLTWDDIDLESRTILYRAEVRKGSYRDAVGAISRQTAKDLTTLKSLVRGKNVFSLGNTATVWRQYTLLLEEAGLPNDRRSKFHRLRRTHATFVHIAGGDATAALGHSSDAITRESYLDPSQVKRVMPWRPEEGLSGFLTACLSFLKGARK